MAGIVPLKEYQHSGQATISSDARRTGRLVSLDAFRGFIMIVLAAEGFGFRDFAKLPNDAPAWKIVDYDTWQTIGHHFRHANWVAIDTTYGIAFWDLIQPAFMFMVGVAMPLSYARRKARGQSSANRLLHALIRSVILVLMGVFLYSLQYPRTNWLFTNVLAQIGLGYFFAYLLLKRTPKIQRWAIAVILTGYWALFYFSPPPDGYDYKAVGVSIENGEVITDHEVPWYYRWIQRSVAQNDGEVFTNHMAPWSKNGNIAFRFDQWLLPKLRTTGTNESEKPVLDSTQAADSEDDNTALGADVLQDQPNRMGLLRRWLFSNPQEYAFNQSGYTTLNFVPSIATALLGVLCGQLLICGKRPIAVVFRLLIGGAICVGLGLAAHVTICPVIKIIWTPSWTLFSGGCVIWMLAVFYLLFDVLPLKKVAWPLQVIGINSLAVYLMGQLLGGWVEDKVVAIHLSGFMETVCGTDVLGDNTFGHIIGPTSVAVVFWLLTVYMYRRRIHIRI